MYVLKEETKSQKNICCPSWLECRFVLQCHIKKYNTATSTKVETYGTDCCDLKFIAYRFWSIFATQFIKLVFKLTANVSITVPTNLNQWI